MNLKKKRKLRAKGWKVSDAAEFLGLTPEESAYIEMKIALGFNLKNQRMKKKLTQTNLAKSLGTSQARVAKMEAGDPSVSLDLLVRALLLLGVKPSKMGKIMGSSHSAFAG